MILVKQKAYLNAQGVKGRKGIKLEDILIKTTYTMS